MKLASLKSGRDGELVIVSRDLSRAAKVPHIAPTLQAALDDWDRLESRLQDVYDALNAGTAEGAFTLALEDLAAPLPRAYQYLDGACYVCHIRRNREARGDTLPDDILDAPLIYQGISHGYGAWNDPIVQNPADMIDFEAEIAAITGDVPRGVSADEAPRYIRLFCLLQDTSLRRIVAPELKRTFGFLTSKPESFLGPLAVTPDELGDLWDGKMVSGTMKVTLRGKQIGNIETGIDSPFHYGQAIAHVAKTRNFPAGTIIGLGTVSNEAADTDWSIGAGCIGEYRAMETIQTGSAKLAFMQPGDRVRIELFDREGKSVMGAIDQEVTWPA
ncbi:fumarylacetoacetate hydrolase family protein [Celeribacter indicus]|uniref:Fumarylacetoacetate hydrolase family protein n=1 Tax=Celeribacter indicus TaxID=1208324 RepID=A0A0B5DV04_9RHOB|nr:fumarylacetoacetate hydrolase family protein [Celeribacter indicus]AJE45045.1 fumarylacetoacetate hydrolase family protein [Celeribacter indicus]SDX42018.1 fumarylacetoacetate (FAA) hydrolase [Celeribacter indicus]